MVKMEDIFIVVPIVVLGFVLELMEIIILIIQIVINGKLINLIILKVSLRNMNQLMELESVEERFSKFDFISKEISLENEKNLYNNKNNEIEIIPLKFINNWNNFGDEFSPWKNNKKRK